MYSLNETARREILEQFVARYIDHVSPENSVNHSSAGAGSNPGSGGPHGGSAGDHRTHDVASEILAIGPIQVEGINIDPQNPQGPNDPTLHEIKVEEGVDEGPPGGPSHGSHHHHAHHHHGGPGGGKNDGNIMVDLGEPDSEMLLVK